jgi:hypothetical protein
VTRIAIERRIKKVNSKHLQRNQTSVREQKTLQSPPSYPAIVCLNPTLFEYDRQQTDNTNSPFIYCSFVWLQCEEDWMGFWIIHKSNKYVSIPCLCSSFKCLSNMTHCAVSHSVTVAEIFVHQRILTFLEFLFFSLRQFDICHSSGMHFLGFFVFLV